MAIRDLIARGFGFAPGSVRFIPTAGLGEAAIPGLVAGVGTAVGTSEVLGAGVVIPPPPPPPASQPTRTPLIRPSLPQAPREYSQARENLLVQALEVALSQLDEFRHLKATELSLNNFSTSGTQLRVGDVFVNANGVLQVVREGDIFVAGFDVSATAGSVTVLTP